MMLVYDYMENGSLDAYLFDEPKWVLSWEQRFGIIKGIAFALYYLHEGFEQVVVHRDVKASNVLLDGEMNGRLGDFGLARLHEHESNSNTTRVVGTLRFLAPELPRIWKASTGSDVYALSSLLLEVLCGRRPIEPNAKPGELVLVDWAWNRYEEGKVLEVVDPRLDGVYDEREVVMVVKLGLMCPAHGLRARPNMRLVVRYLDGEVEILEKVRPLGWSHVARYDDFVSSFASSSLFDRMSCYSNREMEALRNNNEICCRW